VKVSTATLTRIPDVTCVRSTAIVIYPDFQLLDLTGPLAVFDTASRMLWRHEAQSERAYPLLVLSAEAGPVRSSAGLPVLAEASYREFDEPIDTLLVAGGQGSRTAAKNQALLDWLCHMAPRVRRLGSICTGAFVLASAGLLDGKRATTHWAYCSRLAKQHPSIIVEEDAIYIRDGKTYSSAGVTAGMDLALALVEEDLGRALALSVARWLVMFVKRPGGQSQYSAQLAVQSAERAPIRALQEWVLANLEGDLSISALAARAAMSGRNFARVFLRETGTTPAVFVEKARLEAARRLLEDSSLSIDRVALRSGFGNTERLRRAFLRRLGVGPLDYRRRFRSPNHATQPNDEIEQGAAP
jgi:transcriptional regulator GlxA family with amidase domain